MELQTKYISIDEFNAYFTPVDLRADLGGEDAALAFLKRIENRLATFVDSYFNRNIDKLYPEFSDYQKEHYKLALLEQAIYIHRNGDISTDSGYDPEKGEVANHPAVKYASAPNCKQNLILCGIWNRSVKAPGTLYGYRWWRL